MIKLVSIYTPPDTVSSIRFFKNYPSFDVHLDAVIIILQKLCVIIFLL